LILINNIIFIDIRQLIYRFSIKSSRSKERAQELVISDFILEELGPKLVEKFNFPRRDAD